MPNPAVSSSVDQWHKVNYITDHYLSTAATTDRRQPRDVTAFRWVVTGCSDNDVSVKLAELQAFACAKLAGTVYTPRQSNVHSFTNQL